jgi:hypothetical protein
MQEGKNYIIKNIQLLLNLSEEPYELVNGSLLDKFLTHPDHDTIILSCLPTKEFRVVQSADNLPKQGHIIIVSKLKNKPSAIEHFYNIAVRPAEQYRYLAAYLGSVYEPILTRVKDPSLFAIK